MATDTRGATPVPGAVARGATPVPGAVTQGATPVPGADIHGATPVPGADASVRVTGLDALELAAPAGAGVAWMWAVRAWSALWPKALAVGIVLVSWQLVVLSGWKPEYVLPGPGAVVTELGREVTTAGFWHAIGITMRRAVVGFLLAVAIGTALGVAVAAFRPLRVAIGSLVTGLQTMPSVVWFPFAILLFQLSDAAIMFVVILGAAPSIANGLISGIDYVPLTWRRVGAVLGLRGLNLYRHLILPASLPSFVAGAKQGWSFAWRSLMAGELLVIVAGQLSLGARLQGARDLNDAPSLLAFITVILIIGILVDTLFNAANHTLRRRWGLTTTS